MSDPTPTELASRVESAVDALARLPAEHRHTAEEAVRAVAEIHVATLARVIALLAARAPGLVGQAADDELVGHVLLAHGLHPEIDDEALEAATTMVDGPTGPPTGDGTVWIPVESVTRRRPAAAPPTRPDPVVEGEACELCAAPTGPAHRHLLDATSGDVVCVCGACAVLFDRDAAGERFRRIPDRRLPVDDLDLDDDAWHDLGVPVGLAFFVVDGASGGVRALFPSPAGTTEDELPGPMWSRLVERAPLLGELEPDVEALLVHRARGARQQWLVPIDDCYRLVAELRDGWEGITGGTEVWRAVDQFFERLPRPEKEPIHG